MYPPECWSAALLHDLGKLVYLKFFPDHYIALKEHAHKKGCLFSTAEIDLDLPSSSYVGTLLCDYWRLPLIVRDSCESHTLETLYEAIQKSSQPQIPDMVSVCNLLSTLSTVVLASPIKEEIVNVVMGTLKYDQTEFDELKTVVEDLKTEADKFMSQVI